MIKAFLAGALLLAQPAWAQTPVAPTGTLRAAINFGNPVLAQHGPNGAPQGVSVVLATGLAKALGVPLVLVPFPSAGSVTDALAKDVYDVAFLAVDPKRGEGLAFTPPYVLIEGGYTVRADGPFHAQADVDRPGVTVGMATGSAYDLFLSRALHLAEIRRYPTGDDAAAAYLRGEFAVLAGVKAPLERFVAGHAGLRMLPERFMAIDQAMAVPKGRGAAALAAVEGFLAQAKASGTVARALADTGQGDAVVAP